jgi:hypothetical protein
LDQRDKAVALGTWLYNGVAPQRIEIRAKPARFASSRYDDDDRLDESRPIPDTKEGFLYYSWPGGATDHATIEDVKAWADAQPWGPVIWDGGIPMQFIEVHLPNYAVKGKDEPPVAGLAVLISVANIKTVRSDTASECADIQLVDDTHVLTFEGYEEVKEKIRIVAAQNR